MDRNKHSNLSIIVQQLIRYFMVTAYHLPTGQIDGFHKHEQKKLYFERFTHKQILIIVSSNPMHTIQLVL